MFLGLLAHCSTVVRGGRTFCRRIYDAQKVASRTKFKCVRLNSLVKDDIEWWFHFSEIFNGRAAILNSYFMSDIISDASLSGFAVYTSFDWVAGTWSDNIDSNTPCQHIVKSPGFDGFDRNKYLCTGTLAYFGGSPPLV